jgi:hypothetical protein
MGKIYIYLIIYEKPENIPLFWFREMYSGYTPFDKVIK